MLIAFITGIGLGILFFGGLYLSVQQMNKVKHPAALMIISLILRMALVVGGLYLIRGDSYWNIPIALLGIVLVRTVMTGRMKRKDLIKETERG
ncbi:ATP synthase subunit I [Alkalibacter rhizosphaerae]|uniref:ATP synthase subunit I n=1 Tax=Alkalibacter rhizosphaerae TaxID=2815577 RepID=A0A974XET0_9FIRM|nr:ATP synthase subunit I [Alkalibacter rhizosphaerae]QSX08534.1 ATP synthase subunit I [Alkalibacter rhizosphaerae]